MTFIIVTNLQKVMNYSSLIIGFAFALAGIMFALSSPYFVSRLSHKIGAKFTLLSGMVMMVIGSLLLVRISPRMNYFVVLLPAFVIFAKGVSFATSH